MECQKCKKDFEEKDLDNSHDVPTYVFDGDRKFREQRADAYGRHLLCKKCHDIYERIVFSEMIKEADYYTKIRMIKRAQEFSKRWFNGSGTST